jgi:outer membrane murein-binding lipoprotein Lpp
MIDLVSALVLIVLLIAVGMLIVGMIWMSYRQIRERHAVSELDKRVNSTTGYMQDQQAQLSTKLGALDTKAMGTAQGAKTDLTGFKTSIGSQVDTANTDISSIGTDVGTLNSQVADLNKKMSDTSDKLSTLGSDLGTTNTGISGMHDVMTANKYKIGQKWVISGNGDAQKDDDWLRFFNKDGKDYYGGIAAGKLWVGNDSYLNGHANISSSKHGHTMGDWTDTSPMTSWQSQKNKAGSAMGGPQYWSHFPWSDGNTYIRPGIDGAGVILGDIGKNAYIKLASTTGMQDKELRLRDAGDLNHGVAWSSEFGVEKSIDGPALYGCQGGVLGTRCGGTRPVVRWDNKGNVKINGKLHICDEKGVNCRTL